MLFLNSILLLSLHFVLGEVLQNLGPPGRVYKSDINSLDPVELRNIHDIENRISSIVEDFSQKLKKNDKFDPIYFDNEYLLDDPYVFDLQPHEEQNELSMRSLITTWNKLVYNTKTLDDVDLDNHSIQGRTVNRACPRPCHPYAECKNGVCQCKKGFQSTGVGDCEDKNECLTPNACGKNQECLNVFSSYKCRCQPGFISNKKSKDFECIDIDECKKVLHLCVPEARCINTNGSYVCLCKDVSPAVQVKPLKKCPEPDPILSCKPNKIEIKVTEVHLSKFIPAQNALKRNPAAKFLMYLQPNENMSVSENCTLLPNNSSTMTYRFSILPPFNSCSTEQTIDTNSKTPTVVYKNVLWWSVELPKLPFVVIPYKMYEIECKFSLRQNVVEKNATAIVQTFENRTYNKDGQSNISMKFWRIPPSKTYSQPSFKVPMEFVLGEMLYVTVELEKDGVLPDQSYIYLDNCYLSPTALKSKIRTDIVVKGCPSNIPVKHGVLSNGESSVGTFYFQVIQYHTPSTNLFVDCDVLICKQICKPKCSANRVKRSSSNITQSLGEDQVLIRKGIVKVTSISSGPISIVEPVNIEGKSNAKKSNSEKEVDTVPQPPKPKKTHGEAPDNPNSTKRLILPIMLIAANLSILTLLGLLSYALARSVASRRRAERERQDHDNLFEETLGHVSFSPPPEQNKTATPSVKCGSTHSFCRDKNCQFMKDINKGKNHILFGKSNKKKRHQVKESMFKPTVYDVSTLTCPTPFNSPPPSPQPIGTGPAVISVGTSPIKVYSNNRNQSTMTRSIRSEPARINV